LGLLKELAGFPATGRNGRTDLAASLYGNERLGAVVAYGA
jgi:hypothetical protein